MLACIKYMIMHAIVVRAGRNSTCSQLCSSNPQELNHDPKLIQQLNLMETLCKLYIKVIVCV